MFNLTIFLILMAILICLFVRFLYKRKYDVCILITSLMLAVIAYYSAPNSSDDLYRHLEIIGRWKDMPLSIITRDGYQFVYLNNLLMYIVAKLNMPNLYQAIITFGGYYFLQKLVIEECHKNSIQSVSNITFLLISFFLLSFYKIYIMALRNYFCFIVGAYATIQYCEKKYSIFYFLIITFCLVLIHPVSLIFFMIPIYKQLTDKIGRNVIFTLFSLVFLAHKIILEILIQVFPDNNFFITKIAYYINMENQYNVNFIIYYIFLIFFGLFVYCLIRYKGENEVSDDFLALFCILSFSTLYKFELLRRFTYLIPLFLIGPLTKALKKNYILSDFPIVCKYASNNIICRISINKICYFSLFVLSAASVVATIANIQAYGWYWRF